MAAEVVKIKVAQQIALKKEVEAHTFVFHEGLNQLKSDIGKIWFFGYDETDVTAVSYTHLTLPTILLV